MKRWIGLAAALGLVGSCSPRAEPETPAAAATEAGVCWRVRGGAREVLDRSIDNLPTCAQRLEAVRMMEGGAVEGAFEGRSIFVSEAEIVQTAGSGAKRYPVFTPGQRREMQAAIRRLLAAKASRAEQRP